MAAFVNALDPVQRQILTDLLAVLCAAVNTTLRRFAADQLEDGDNTLAALTDTFGADWVQNLPKVSPSNNRDEGALGSTKIHQRKCHNIDSLKLQGKQAFARNKTSSVLARLHPDTVSKLMHNAKRVALQAGSFTKRKQEIGQHQHARQLVKHAEVRRLQSRQQALQERIDGLLLLPLTSTVQEVRCSLSTA